uniref:sarcosine oxidase subunit gamma n=1 Tax=Halomonas sp. TaxID=1486246 RepID=UPI00260D2DEC|nr:sarcosine oxidase subunit gamma family protein [Halomonas sp.]
MSESVNHTDRANTYDACPGADIAQESPLAWSFFNSGAPAPRPNSRVVLRELADRDHLILRGGAIVLDEAVRQVFGVSLPARPQQLVVFNGGVSSLQWLSPDEWLLIVPFGQAYRVETELRQVLGGASVAISDVSAGQTLVELHGEDLAMRELLMKSVAYDVHPRNFPPGKGVTVVMAKSSAILRRPDDSRWELVIRRSFADYLYRWLLDAGEEFEIGVDRNS